MKTTNEYCKHERKLMKEYFEKNDITQYQFSPDDSFEQWDGKCVIGDSQIIFEVKVRNIPSFRYKTTIIEESKYDFLINYTKETKVKPYIFIFFTDGKVLKKNLKNVNKNTIKKIAPIMTSEDKGEKEKTFVEIEITELNLENY